MTNLKDENPKLGSTFVWLPEVSATEIQIEKGIVKINFGK